jgi:hypothetical protein
MLQQTQEESLLRKVSLHMWKLFGPFTNMLLYGAVAIFFYVTGGCDVLPGNDATIYYETYTTNIYYEVNDRWKGLFQSQAIKEIVSQRLAC